MITAICICIATACILLALIIRSRTPAEIERTTPVTEKESDVKWTYSSGETQTETDTIDPLEDQEPHLEVDIVPFVTRILSDAVHQSATQIEINPSESAVHIKYLIDGNWQAFKLFEENTKYREQLITDGQLVECDEIWCLSPHYNGQLLRRLKVMADINYYDQKYPLIGSAKYDTMLPTDEIRRWFDLNLCITRTEYGESVTIDLVEVEAPSPVK